MLTFQILDGGETFYRALEPRPLTLGSDPSCDVRLGERGVQPRHARIEPVQAEEGTRWQIVDEGGGVRVDGRAVQRAMLELGDRIELGHAVLVLGRSVRRAATPRDVLARGPRRVRRTSARGAARWTFRVGVGAAALVLIVGFLWPRPDRLPIAFEQQERLRIAGRFDEARQVLSRLRHDWAGLSPRRQALVERALAKLESTQQATSELRARLVREAPRTTWAEQLDQLRSVLRERPDSPRADAARLLRTELHALREDAIEAHGWQPFDEPVAAGAKAEPGPRAGEGAERVGAAAPETPETGDESVEAEPAGPMVVPGRPGVATALRRAQRLREAGALTEARRALLETAASVQESDPEYATVLRQRADDVARLVAFAATLEPGDSVVLRDGEEERLTGTDEGRLRVATEGGEREITLADLDPVASAERLAAGSDSADAWLGAAVLALEDGDFGLCERCLARALEVDPDSRDDVDGILRRARVDPADAAPYRLVQGRFLSRHELRADRLTRELTLALADALAAGPEEREEFLREARARGKEARAPLIEVLGDAQLRLAARLERNPFHRRSLRPLLDLRRELDRLRERALDLVHDKERYFFPHEPAEVGEERAGRYREVQAQVAARIAEVESLWRSRLVVRIPRGLAAEVERFRWISGALVELGEPRTLVEERLEWALALPDGDSITLRDVCLDRDERADARLADRITALNERLAAELSRGERRHLQRVNEYRLMMGLAPLALNPALVRAAREHSAEMQSLGYFGHWSPTPGRRTPIDRARRTGYTHPVSENCVLAQSWEQAYAWVLESSGHHRNLLAPEHAEIGIGRAGRYWTLMLGLGREFLRDPRLPPVERR